MASDLISRDRLLGDLYAEWLLCTPDTPTFINGELQRCEKAKLIEDGMKLVQDQPTVDAAPVVHGEWERISDRPKTYIRRCSVCNRDSYICFSERNYNFCPWCSAKMDGGDK